MSGAAAAAGASRPFLGKWLGRVFGFLKYKHGIAIFFLLVFLAGSIQQGIAERDAGIIIKSLSDSILSIDEKIKETVNLLREQQQFLGSDLPIRMLLFPSLIIIGSLFYYYYWYSIWAWLVDKLFSKAATSFISVFLTFAVFFFILQTASHVISAEAAGEPTNLGKLDTWVNNIPFSGIWHKDGLAFNLDLFITPINNYNPFGNPAETIQSDAEAVSDVVNSLQVEVVE